MEIKDRFDRGTAAFLLTGILLGAIAATSLTGGLPGNGEATAQELVSTLEKSSGQDLELVNVESENGLYKAQIKNSQNQLSTYYITQEGKMVMQEGEVTDLDQFSSRVDAQADFTGCMTDRGVVMYGNISQQETVAQVQLLGGMNQISDIYRDINNEDALRSAVQDGVRRVPAFNYQNSTIQGIQSVGGIENLTGCSYSLEN